MVFSSLKLPLWSFEAFRGLGVVVYQTWRTHLWDGEMITEEIFDLEIVIDFDLNVWKITSDVMEEVKCSKGGPHKTPVVGFCYKFQS